MRFSRENMGWVFLETNSISPSQPQQFPITHQNLQSNSSFDLNSKISPTILLIIIIMSILFFVSGLLHLLVRFLLTPPNRHRDDFDNATALQGQLQQLFHLHDSGVDQSFIDTLPVFQYKSITGLKDPFDCAVCLSEFEPENKLRLLPTCSHAFHMVCIDTWLLSHSTCPLCRSNLLHDFSSTNNNASSPFVLVLESGSDSSIEIVTDRENNNVGRSSSGLRDNSHSHLGFDGNSDFRSTHFDLGHNPDAKLADSSEKVVHVKLGKFRNLDGGEGSSNNNNVSNDNKVDDRRCFSMGSYEYVMDDESVLKVHVPMKKLPSKNPSLSTDRAAMSECGFDSMREFKFNAFESTRIAEETNGNAIKKNGKKESFSISKIWLRSRKETASNSNNSEDICSSPSTSKRAFSFRFPVQRNGSVEPSDEENSRTENLESLEAKTPSFARSTMLWLVGKQKKVAHSSSTLNF